MSGPDDGPGTPSLRWHPRSLVCLVASGALVALGLAVRSPVPLFAALPLLLAPAAAALDAPRGSPRARLTWAVAGSAAEVQLSGRLDGFGALPPKSLALTFYRPAPLEEVAPPEVLYKPDHVEFRLRWRAPFPCLSLVPIPEVVWRDPLALAELPVLVDGAALHVERFPPEVARVGSARLRRTTALPGEIRSRALGSAGEFFAVRPAAPGDTPREINWRASARAGRLLANEFLLERTGDLLILLDTRPTTLGTERDAKLLSVGRAAALGIATGFLDEKARVGLGVFEEFLTAVPLGSGRLQRFRIRRALEQAHVGTTGGPPERLAVSLRRYFPPGVATLLITPLADDGATLLLPHLRRRGFPTFVLSPSPLPLLGGAGGTGSEEDRLAERLTRLVRRRRLSDAWQEAPVIDWEAYWSLAPLARFLQAPLRNRPGAS